MEIRDIPISQIQVSNMNTRKDLAAGNEDSSIDDLARSIAEKGLLNPVMVRITGPSSYEIVAGQRRFLACQKLGWTNIPALVRSELADTDATAISLIENVHRAEMNPMDKARAFAALRDGYGGDIQRVSKETGVGSATVKRYLALLTLPPEIQNRISTAEGPAKIEALSALSRTFDDAEDMVEAYNKTAGFSQEIQKKIFKASGGDISQLDELVAQAHEGAFDIKVCKGLTGCPHIPEELAPTVIKLVDQWQTRNSETENVRETAKKLKI